MYILDTSVIISSLIKRSNVFFKLELAKKKGIKFYIPKYLMKEISKKIDKIAKYSKLSKEEIVFLLGKLLKGVEVIDDKIIKSKLKEAFEVVPDKKDVVFVAASLATGYPILTFDKELVKKAKKYKAIYFEDFKV